MSEQGPAGESKLQPDIRLPKCAIAGCTDLPTVRLPEPMKVPDLIWCKPHADLLARLISERNYKDFIDAPRKQGFKREPILANEREFVEKRRCCVPKCEGDVVTEFSFAPYRYPGTAWTCALHSEALQYTVRQLNGQRLIQKMQSPNRGERDDPVAQKRRSAILAAYAVHHGKPKYIEAICRDLQRERIKMLLHWVEEWNGKYSLGLQEWDWLVAYDSARSERPEVQRRIQTRNSVSKSKLAKVRGRIQKYISRTCKLNPAPA